ncbi:MAG: zinc ribbon domain-containing protein [Betaproteobacteria bacterium]|nr:zinc ribbon domain-containing protein [Betaproteobacteria bacterium]
MPIYAYRCQDCGFEKDQLQKISDAPLTVCPSCNGNGFARQLTAPAFQLKGSGWYVTDFRDGGNKKAGGEGGESADKTSDKPTDTAAGSGSAGSGEAKADSKPAATESSSGSGGGSAGKAGESPAASTTSSAATPRAASSPSPGAPA